MPRGLALLLVTMLPLSTAACGASGDEATDPTADPTLSEGDELANSAHGVIVCPHLNCDLSKWSDRHEQELGAGNHYYDEFGNDLGIMDPNPVVNVGMRHRINVNGATITMVYAFHGVRAGWVAESAFNGGAGVDMPTYVDRKEHAPHVHHFKTAAENNASNAHWLHKCINPSGCNGQRGNTVSDYLPETKFGIDVINLPEGVPEAIDPHQPSVHGSVVSATTVKVDDPRAVFHASNVKIHAATWNYDANHPNHAHLSAEKVEWVYGEINHRWCWVPRMALK